MAPIGNPGHTSGTVVQVEPTPMGKWLIRKDGFQTATYNQKSDAVSKARSIARSNSGKLEVMNQNMNVSESKNYS